MTFEELVFKNKSELYDLGQQALYSVDGYTISIITGNGSHSTKTHPYEIWSFPTPTHDPFGCLTKEDVEWFINNKCYKDYSKFENYLESKGE